MPKQGDREVLRTVEQVRFLRQWGQYQQGDEIGLTPGVPSEQHLYEQGFAVKLGFAEIVKYWGEDEYSYRIEVEPLEGRGVKKAEEQAEERVEADSGNVSRPSKRGRRKKTSSRKVTEPGGDE